jgi:hypothetical protein
MPYETSYDAPSDRDYYGDGEEPDEEDAFPYIEAEAPLPDGPCSGCLRMPVECDESCPF